MEVFRFEEVEVAWLLPHKLWWWRNMVAVILIKVLLLHVNLKAFMGSFSLSKDRGSHKLCSL